MDELPLYARLAENYLECPLTENLFLPLNVIDEEITEANVKEELPGKVSKTLNPQLPRKVVKQTKRIFAVLVIIGEPQAIKELLAEGITDDDLPLSRENGQRTTKVLVSGQDGSKAFQSFSSWKDGRRIDDFLDKQWLVQCPVIDASGRAIKLNKMTALPFEKVDPVGHNIHVTVYKSDVHPAHHQGLDGIEGKLQVATKEFRDHSIFVQEKNNLDKTKGVCHPHLIPSLATYEKDRTFYIIFPWANGGNLLDFWKRKNLSKPNRDLALWSLQQLLGIAKALHALHEMNCRHGDLKPENILHFKDKTNGGRLVIADVGVSKIHREATILRRDGTTTRATTIAYEAPEAVGDKTTARSRTYDIWSLGCVFLEYIIWLLEDVAAIDRFHDAREGPNHEFYFLPRPSGTPAVVHPTVYGAIDNLRNDARCRGATALGALGDLVANRMLLVDVDKRDTADAVVDKLQKIVSDAQQDPGYLYNDVGADAPKLTFLPRKISVMYESSSETIYEEPSETD